MAFDDLMGHARLRPHLRIGRPATGASAEPPRSLIASYAKLSVRVRASVIAALIVTVGLSASAFLAFEWRASALDANRKSFASTAADLGSSLGSRLKANLSLTRAVRSIATLEPHASETRFMQWYHQLQRGSTTSTDVVAVLIQPIPASRLAAFKSQAEGDPGFRAVLGGRFQILPPGRRKVYCLTRAIVGNPRAISLYPGLLDYCAPALSQVGRSPVASLAAQATDTGAFVATSTSRVWNALDGRGRRSGLPTRRACWARSRSVARAFTGSVGTTFDGGALVKSRARRSLDPHDQLWITRTGRSDRS
jgi:hypothetical protein